MLSLVLRKRGIEWPTVSARFGYAGSQPFIYIDTHKFYFGVPAVMTSAPLILQYM